MDKVFVIKNSLRCYILGWFGLLPVLGLVPAVIGIILHKRVQLEAGNRWNPAKFHLVCGCILSWLGLSLSAVALVVALMLITKSWLQ